MRRTIGILALGLGQLGIISFGAFWFFGLFSVVAGAIMAAAVWVIALGGLLCGSPRRGA